MAADEADRMQEFPDSGVDPLVYEANAVRKQEF